MDLVTRSGGEGTKKGPPKKQNSQNSKNKTLRLINLACVQNRKLQKEFPLEVTNGFSN